MSRTGSERRPDRGAWRRQRVLIGPPSEYPNRAARSDLAASRTAMRSSMSCSKRGRTRKRVRDPLPALVVEDHSRKGRELLKEASGCRQRPDEVYLREKARDEHKVKRPLAEHLVADVDSLALDIPGLRMIEHCVASVYGCRARRCGSQKKRLTGRAARSPPVPARLGRAAYGRARARTRDRRRAGSAGDQSRSARRTSALGSRVAGG